MLRNYRKGIKNNLFNEAKKRLLSITFCDKDYLSGGIELADFVSYVVFAYLENKLKLNKGLDLGLIWKPLSKEIIIKDLTKVFSKKFINSYMNEG